MYKKNTNELGVPRGYVHQILLIMRLTTIILIMTIMQVSASTFAQRITLSERNARLTQVFDRISDQSGYDFVFTSDLLKGTKPVTINVKNIELDKVLEQIFANQPVSFSIEGKTVVIMEKEKGFFENLISKFRAIDVRGKILDEKGQPLVGATVAVKGTNRSVRTNEEGEFTITDVDENALLKISYLGYKVKEIKVAGDLGDVVMEISSGELDEVNVMFNTGYQKLPKERTTGSFVQVDQKLFNDQVGTSVLDRLPNIANSLSVDRRTSTAGNFSIRGISTIQGPKSPLIVLDNFPYHGDLSNLNPNDIESITLLKDAAAASIWGTKAGNGVIVITTKKGKFNQPALVTFNSSLNVGAEPDLYKISRISTSDMIDIEHFLFDKGKYEITNPASTRLPVTPLIALLRKKEGGTIDNEAVETQINLWRDMDVRDEFANYFYQPMLNQQYALSLNSGNETLAWKAMFGYDKNKSDLNASYNRINLNLQSTLRPLKKLELTIGIQLTKSTSESGKPAYGTFTMTGGGEMPSYGQFADEYGAPLPWAKDYSLQYTESAGAGKLLDWNYYPLEDYKHSKSTSGLLNVIADMSANYKIIDGFGINIFYRYGRQQVNSSTLNEMGSYQTRNLINTYTQINTTTGDVVYKVPPGAIRDLSNIIQPSHNLRGQLSFNKDWAKQSLNIVTGAEISEDESGLNRYRFYGYDIDFLTYGQVDYTSSHLQFASGSKGYIPENSAITQTINHYVSAYFNAAYTFNKLYTFSLSARKDGSNLFGVLPNNRFNPLGSIGLAWNISNEKFFNMHAIPYLKLRATYGLSGNTDQNSTAYPKIGYYGNSKYTLTPYAKLEGFANPELRWEKVAMLNIGIDYQFKNNRISGSIEYYHKRARDLFGMAQVDYTGGVGSTIIQNVGGISGQGIDIELNSLNIVSNKFKWQSALNLNLNTDQIENYYTTAVYGNRLVGNSSPIISGIVGRPVYAVYSYKWIGLDVENGDPIGMINGLPSKDYTAINGNGTRIEDLTYHGSALPTFFGNLRNIITYKDFSISITLNYKFGYYFKKRSINYNGLYNSRTGHADYEKRWRKPGDELHTSVPSQIYPAIANRDAFYDSSEINVIKGDHIRLQYITLNYNLFRKNIHWLPLSSINIYANVNNIGIIWSSNRNGIDPEYPETTLPQTKNIAIGIKMDF